MTLDFIQIIYEEYQREKCYPFATIHKNEACTIFFENSVIANIVPKSSADLIGVCSWRLSQKRGDMFRLADKTLTREKILAHDFDVAILTPRGHTDIETKLLHWHPKDAVQTAIEDFRRRFGFPSEVKRSIYENHFIARGELYRRYCSDMLKPAINYMAGLRDIYMVDAGYINRKQGREREAALRLLASWGRTDYPLAPFILERLFSIWISDQNLKVIDL